MRDQHFKFKTIAKFNSTETRFGDIQLEYCCETTLEMKKLN